MAVRKSIAWILNFTSKLPNDEEKIKCLQQNDNGAIRTVLKYTFDPNVEWALPEGAPPYKPNEYEHQENVLYSEARKLYLFIKGGNDNLKPFKREMLFQGLLEAVHPDDAVLLLAAKDKTLPYEGLDAKIVKKAFPDLW